MITQLLARYDFDLQPLRVCACRHWVYAITEICSAPCTWWCVPLAERQLMPHCVSKGKHFHCLLCFVHRTLGSVITILDSRAYCVQGSEGSAAASAPSMPAVRSQGAIEPSAAGHKESYPGELPLPEARPGISQSQSLQASLQQVQIAASSLALRRALLPVSRGLQRCLSQRLYAWPQTRWCIRMSLLQQHRLSLSLGVQMSICRHPKMQSAPAAASMMTRQSPAGVPRQSNGKWLEPCW